MRTYSRRSVLASLGVTLPFGLGAGARSHASAGTAPTLRFRAFEDALRAALASQCGPTRRVRVEIGHPEPDRAGFQGSHNDRPFAGFPAGHLRIVRAGTEPGPVRQGVRLYVSTVDVALTGGPIPGPASRPLDFATLPPAPMFA